MKRFWAGLLCLMLLCGAVCAETLNGRNASGNVSIPYGVLNIESEAFAGCADIISLRIPETVKSLGDGAFRDCPALTTVVIEKGLTTIGACAFAGNGALRSVTLPDSVLSIEDTAFEDCASLTLTVAEGSYAEQYAKKLGIPYTHEQSGDAKVWINRRYMNNLRLVDPVTLDELSEVVQHMKTNDPDGNGINDTLIAAAATEDDLRLIPQAVGASQEQASLFLASGNLGTCKVGAFSFDVLPLFVVKLEIPAEYQADYEAFEPTLPSVTPTLKPAVTPTPAPTFNPNAKVWINRRYMDKLGLVDPVTLDELSEVVQHMKTNDPDGNGINDTLIAAAATEDDLRLIPQAVGASQEQASLFLASGNLGTCKVGAFSFDVLPLFVVKLEIPAEYQADYEAFEPTLPSVTPTLKPAVTPTPAPTFNPNAKVWINRRYMDKLGLVDPVTLDELSEVVQHMKTNDPDGNGINDTLIAAAATEDDLRLIPQAVGASQEQASLFLASGNLGTCKVGAFSFDVLPLFVVKLEIPAEYQADYEAFEPTLPSVTPTLKPAVTPTPAPTFNPNAKVWINRRYMDKLGLVDPVTLDELSEVVQHMKTNDPDGNGINDTLIAAAATEDDLRLIPQAVGASQEQASLFLASGNLGTCKVGAFSFDVLPLFVVKLEIPAEYQADYEAFEPKLPSVTPTPRPTANPNAKVWINRTFMDNMGLVDPATLDELESVIEAMKTGDPDGNGVDDTIIGAAGNADELCLIPQAVGTTKEQAALFIAAGNLGTTVIGEIDFEKRPLFVVADVIPAEYQADYEAFEPKLPSVTPTPRPTANPNAKVWINRTFMDNMGLVDPATLDELESVIEAMKTGDPDGNGVDDTIIGAAGNADELCLIPQAVGTTKEQAALFIAAGNLGTTVIGEIDFEKRPLFVVADVIPAEYQADYEAFEPKLPSVTPTPRPTANPNAKVWINRTFMDNMGLVDPATLDELESVIEAMKTGDPDGNGVDDTIIGAAGNADELCLIPQAVGTTKEQAALFIAAGNLGTTVIGEIDFEKQPLFVVTDTIPAAYQAIYERF